MPDRWPTSWRTEELREQRYKSALSHGGLAQDPLAETSNFGHALIARSTTQEVHLSLDAAETLPTKPDEASRVDFGLRETERLQGDA